MEVVNQDVIETRWVLNEQGEKAEARLVMEHFNTWNDGCNEFYVQDRQFQFCSIWSWHWQQNVSYWASHKQLHVSLFFTAFLRPEMRDEACIKMDADTRRLIREEQLPDLQPLDSEGFYKETRGLSILEKTLWLRQRKVLDSNPASKMDNFRYIDTRCFIQFVHVDDEPPLSGADRLVRDMVQKLNHKFLVGVSHQNWRHN